MALLLSVAVFVSLCVWASVYDCLWPRAYVCDCYRACVCLLLCGSGLVFVVCVFDVLCSFRCVCFRVAVFFCGSVCGSVFEILSPRPCVCFPVLCLFV